jgi:lambda repressor-like predicted transcriptional regulator
MTTLPAFANARERNIWVKAQLELGGQSFAGIARAHGWSRGAVAAAMRVPSDPQEKALAAALGVSQAALFPERYDLLGKRLHHVRENNDVADNGNVKHEKAA